jgi:3-oxoacyl-[acyl-carrier protein] reductase
MSDNLVALITGATRGIGRAIAISLAENGYDIAFCYHKAVDKAKMLAEEIESMGRKVYLSQCDVSDFGSVVTFVKSVENDLGQIDVLVNNAGITSDNLLIRMDVTDWDKVLDTNLNSVFYFCKATIFELLKRKSGRIVNISSVSGVYGNAGQINYCASKAGIIGLSKSLAKEVGGRGITVNVVAPGVIRTDMTKDVDEGAMKEAMKNTALNRLGEVQDVANLVSFLASEKASFITGQTICVDGGLKL